MPGGFFKVNNSIFDEKLTAHEFYIYCYLLRCDNPQNGCFPSKKTIADACGIAVSTVSKCIQSLEKKGLIRITHNYQNSRKQNNSYTILR